MPTRQQVLYLWLAEGALDTGVVSWAFHDGCAGRGPQLPSEEPPYPTGVAALHDGWCLLQSPAARPIPRGADHEPGPLSNEYVFERRIELSD